MTRNIRPRNYRNGVDGDTAASNQALQVAEMAGVEQLALTHHDPTTTMSFSSASKNCVGNNSKRGAAPPRNANLELGGQLKLS